MGFESWISFASLLRSFFPAAKDSIDDEKQAFILKFKLLQSIHLETQQMLKDFIAKHGCGDVHLMTGFTYSQYLKALEDNFPTSNSDKVLENSISIIKTKPQLDFFMQEIENQYQSLNFIYQNLKNFKDR